AGKRAPHHREDAVRPSRRRLRGGAHSMSMTADAHAKAHMVASDLSTELASRRTGMSFQRTRMSADRTLMSIIRTSLSLIGFGFTIFQLFEKLRDAQVLRRAEAPRNFGIALAA